MTYVPLKYPPGVCKIDTPYTDYLNGGRITDMNFFRFHAGQPERIGGAVQILSSEASAYVRGMNDLRDFSGNIYLVAGNSEKLEQAVSTSTSIFNNITPLRIPSGGTGSISAPFSTVNGSPTVTVTHTAHQQQTGDFVAFLGTYTAGGLVISGVYPNIAVTGTNDYTFVSPSSASATTTAVGGTVAYNYYRHTLSNPFQSVQSSGTVVVTHTAHGGTSGDYVSISGGAAVGGITLGGEYLIRNPITADTYRIVHSTAATSTATGGGSPNFRYNIASDHTGENRFWSLPNYGQTMLVSPTDGTIYIWNPALGGRPYPLSNAPTGVKSLFVTPERYVFALGNSDNPMQVSWPDREDNTQWDPLPTNTANSRTLQEGSKLVGGIPVRERVSLVLSDTAAYLFTYTGDSFVYDSVLIGKNCGLVGPLAIAVKDGVAYWLSHEDAYAWDGTLHKLPIDDIRDHVFNNIRADKAYKSVCRPISSKDEIWMLYPSEDGIFENDLYFIYHIDQRCCSIGQLSVASPATDMLDRNYFSTPAVDRPYPILSYDGVFLAFDIPSIEDTSIFDLDFAPSITYSPIDIAQGGYQSDIFGFIPDFQQVGTNTAITAYVTLMLQDYPASATALSTHAIRQNGTTIPRVDLRTSARLVGHKIELGIGGSTYTDPARLGTPRIDIQPGGARK